MFKFAPLYIIHRKQQMTMRTFLDVNKTVFAY